MLNIFYGRESIDKEKFIYENIFDRGLIIVPDQYILDAEKKAFKYLGTKGLMNIEIIGMSRFGYRLLSELGGSKKTFIDKYGRHILLTQIIADKKNELTVFKGAENKNSVVELINNFISELKQYSGSLKTLIEKCKTLEEGSYMKRKTEDLAIIFSEYQDRICGKYIDLEDYTNLFIDKISDSKLVKDNQIWLYGFDSFLPRETKVIGKLMSFAKDVNVVITYDTNIKDSEIFTLTEDTIKNLEIEAKINKILSKSTKISDKYGRININPAIAHLETELYVVMPRAMEDTNNITLVNAANQYNEAETAAAYIFNLVQNEGLRYRDIAVICNDQKKRSSIIERVFSEYGIEIFLDKKRTILYSVITLYIVSLISIMTNEYRTSDIFNLLKTGFTELSRDEIDELENYGIKYEINGTMWKNTFENGNLEYGSDKIEKLNEIRQKAITPIVELEKYYNEAQTTKDFIQNFYKYLNEVVLLPSQIEAYVKAQENEGLFELSEETQQIWAKIVEILDKIVALIGEKSFDGKIFWNLLIVGLKEAKVGITQKHVDGILVNTIEKSSFGDIKALVVIGANEGILPRNSNDEGLFSYEEINLLNKSGKEICKPMDVKDLEEKMAIYRNISKPEKYLWVSNSLAGEDGAISKPSELFLKLKNIFPNLKTENDVLNSGCEIDQVGGQISTLRHLTEAISKSKTERALDDTWKEALLWFKNMDDKRIDAIRESMNFTNEQAPIEKKLVEMLYKKNIEEPMSISPSRLERYSRCPFLHFINYGLKLDEQRIFEVAGREIGDVYHSCIMKLSNMLTEEGVAITSKESKWMTITRDECTNFVEKIVDSETENYRDGVFKKSGAEKYRTARLKSICADSCWMLIDHVRSGEIETGKFEVAFGRGKAIKPIEIEVDNEKVYIEGKIDRVDFLPGNHVKIIDYKSGSEKFNIKEAKAGYRLQLMLYLNAAEEGIRKPAGVFYYMIDEPKIDVTGIQVEKREEVILTKTVKSYKLNGIMVNDNDVINQIAGGFDGFSDIVQIRRTKEKVTGTGKNSLLSEEEFEEMETAVNDKVAELCKGLINGNIEIRPMKSGDESTCTYCKAKGICRFDTFFEGCNFEII